jgi:hypothetical protein
MVARLSPSSSSITRYGTPSSDHALSRMRPRLRWDTRWDTRASPKNRHTTSSLAASRGSRIFSATRAPVLRSSAR